jgi:peptidoglycan/LPS O-acetylase OafA/YrhL
MTAVHPAATRPEASALPARLPSLTGLRWVAAMLVFGYHVGTMRVMADPDHALIVKKLFTLGLSGVQFFFVLSGFVLVWSARPGEAAHRFLRRRLAKIFPSHAVMWAVVLGALLWWGFAVDPFVALGNLLLVQAWNPDTAWFYSVNNVSWSLSCELFFYVCLPLALPVLRRARERALYAVVIAMPLLILALWPAQELLPPADRWWFTQVFPLTRSLEFWLGAAAAELLRRDRWRGPGLPVATGIFVLTWAVAGEWVPAYLWTTILAAVYVTVITAAARADLRGAWSPWRGPVLRWLGEVSFAYYLVHVFVIGTALRLLERTNGFPGWQGPAAALGFLALCLGCAALLHRYVELPMMRLLSPGRRAAAPDRTR